MIQFVEKNLSLPRRPFCWISTAKAFACNIAVQLPIVPWIIGAASEVVWGRMLVPDARYPTVFSTPGIVACAAAAAGSNNTQNKAIRIVRSHRWWYISHARHKFSGTNIRQNFQILCVKELDPDERHIV